jgi:NADH-quinone oxidoreductase subunit F
VDLASFRPVLLTRPPAAGRESLADYEASGGYDALRRALAELDPAALCRLIEESELRGRGGAAFPTGRKWELARAGAATPKYVVANGGEHEPGSRKDRLLVATHPHRVIEGIALAAFATGAAVAYLYLIEDMAEAIASAETAIGEAQSRGYLGQGVLGSDLSLEVRIKRAPTTYVAGEESAALEVIEGRAALPRKKPPYPGESGLFGRPTTVNNVETLAHVPGIVRHGAGWFRALGVPGSSGTMLFTLDDAVRHPGVYELPFGATFRDLIEGRGGGLRSGRALRAILPAMSCAFLPATAIDLPLDHASLRAVGSSLGCGGVTLVEEGECLLERSLAIARFFMTEQCGQCPPCRMETSTIAAVLAKVQGGDAGDYRAQIEKIAAFTARKGYCSLIEMAATPVLSALRLFPDDFAHHAAHGTCRAGGAKD